MSDTRIQSKAQVAKTPLSRKLSPSGGQFKPLRPIGA